MLVRCKRFSVRAFYMLAISIPSGPCHHRAEFLLTEGPLLRCGSSAISIMGCSRGHFADAIRGELLTHVNYALPRSRMRAPPFLAIRAWTSATVFLNAAKRRQVGRTLRICIGSRKAIPFANFIAIGGWTWSENFSNVALNADSRERFVARIALPEPVAGLFTASTSTEYPSRRSCRKHVPTRTIGRITRSHAEFLGSLTGGVCGRAVNCSPSLPLLSTGSQRRWFALDACQRINL